MRDEQLPPNIFPLILWFGDDDDGREGSQTHCSKISHG